MRLIGIVVYPSFRLIGLSAASVLDIANSLQASPFYDVRVVSDGGGLVRSSSGVSVQTEPLQQTFDTIIVAGGASELQSPALLDAIKEAAGTSRRVASTCTGAFLLAGAGLLDGKRATTHWFYAPEFQRRFPKVKLEEDRIFVTDGAVWTSAGMSAVFDLSLALVEADLGRDTARAVGRQLVLYHRRAGGQSQYSRLLELDPKSDRVQSVVAFARQNLQQELTVEQLAGVARLSPRQFSRVFRTELGKSPAKVVEQLRVEAAQLMLEDGGHSIEDVVRETGFANREQLRRAFLRILGQSPQAVRRSGRLQRTA